MVNHVHKPPGGGIDVYSGTSGYPDSTEDQIEPELGLGLDPIPHEGFQTTLNLEGGDPVSREMTA